MGCKASVDYTISQVRFRFYLNYVGCKVSRGVLLLPGFVRFTLTMWDVKNGEEITDSCAGRFYLNYVGCKVASHICCITCQYEFYLNYVGCKVIFF